MLTGPILPPPGPDNDWNGAHVRRMLEALARAGGPDLAAQAGIDPGNLGQGFYFGDFALLSHRGDAAVTLNYGNALALKLWECGWPELTAMSSRETAPREGRAEREAMMAQVAEKGFVAGYSGERISRGGRRFMIQDGIVWRLREANGDPFGVAAFVPRFRYL